MANPYGSINHLREFRGQLGAAKIPETSWSAASRNQQQLRTKSWRVVERVVSIVRVWHVSRNSEIAPEQTARHVFSYGSLKKCEWVLRT